VIERLTDMPPGTIGFRAAGEIEREDYDEVLTPELRRALDAGDGLRTLYLIEDIDEIEPRALWADSKLGFDVGVRHRDAWIRSAIVTDIAWMVQATKLFLWMIPGEARLFPTSELEQAKAWVAGEATEAT
jgi:stage II sporulation SpoAA-like protein